MAALSATSAWVAGPGCGNLVSHWNGKKWTEVSTPGPGHLTGVAMAGARDGWIVGGAGGSTVSILRWNGSSWKRLAVPADGRDSYPQGVAATSASNAWIVGQKGHDAMILHWNGTAWK